VEWFFAIIFVLSSTGVLGGVGYLIKRGLEQFAALNLESHKGDLAEALARFQGQIERINVEHQTVFTSMHARRAEVIEDLYDKLAATQEALTDMTAPIQFEERSQEQRQSTIEKYNDARRLFDKKRLYLQKAAANKADELLKMMRIAIHNYDISKGNFSSQQEGNAQKWLEAWENVSEAIPPVLEELADEFRDILGIENKSSDDAVSPS